LVDSLNSYSGSKLKGKPFFFAKVKIQEQQTRNKIFNIFIVLLVLIGQNSVEKDI